MSFLALNVPFQKTAGLCNQLYNIVQTTIFGIKNNYKFIILDKFLKECNSENYCPVKDVIDISKTNFFLRKYNIALIDGFDCKLHIDSVIYGNDRASLNVTDFANTKFKNNNDFIIEKNTDLNEIFGYNCDISCNKKSPSLFIHYRINDVAIFSFFSTNNGLLSEKIQLCFNNIFYKTFHPEGTSIPVTNDGSYEFNDILTNIYFQNTLTQDAVIYRDQGSGSGFGFGSGFGSEKINVIHIRLEDDAVQHWGKEYCYDDLELYKKKMEDVYISSIIEAIQKDEITILLSFDYNNRVVEYMKTNKYNILIPPKMNKYRELSAINDMIIAEKCNNVFIGVYESSFAFTVLKRIQTNIEKRGGPPLKQFIFKMNFDNTYFAFL